MRVRDLIKDTVWLPSRDYDTARPAISVLLPTFRRGHDGSFINAANSILNQSLTDLELIIIDDGSTDGTAQQITSLMTADPRVSCLRHRNNIGLPALSEYEAFMRARGDYIAFGFDDFIFERDALSELRSFPLTSPRCVVHGYVGWLDRAGQQHTYGKDALPHERLRFFNFLGNASFLVPRSILADVGLFDPHIAAARLCDWDLWRRILKKYPIHRAPVFVGVEYGHTRPDSLENTYPLFEESLQEYFSVDRNELLRPAGFPDYDIWKMPERPSAMLAAHVLRARQFFRSRDWARDLRRCDAEEAAILVDPQRRTIGVYGPSIPATLEGLPEAERQDLLYIHPDLSDPQLAYYLAGCGLVVMTGESPEPRDERVKAMCGAMGIPVSPVANLHGSLREIIGRTQPTSMVDWVARLRRGLEQESSRAVLSEARFAAADAELAKRANRLAAAEAEFASRSYRLGLKVRAVANGIRWLAAFLGLR
jgi:glycosyltransferase involved in cell wall biosynthesis